MPLTPDTLHAIASEMRITAERLPERPESYGRAAAFMWAQVVDQAAVGGCTARWADAAFACRLAEGHDGLHLDPHGDVWGDQKVQLHGWIADVMEDPR